MEGADEDSTEGFRHRPGPAQRRTVPGGAEGGGSGDGASPRLTKYGASGEQPKDDAVYYPGDDEHGFFARVKLILEFRLAYL